MFGCCHQGKPRTTTPQRTVRTASRAPTHCCAPGTASRPYWMCSGYRPSRALRRTVASHCASANQPCPSKTTSKRGVTPSSKANQLFLRRCWLASPVSVLALRVPDSSCVTAETIFRAQRLPVSKSRRSFHVRVSGWEKIPSHTLSLEQEVEGLERGQKDRLVLALTHTLDL